MEYVINEDVKGKKYKELLDYLFTRCDAVSFLIQRYNKCFVTPKNHKIFEIEGDNHKIGDHFFDHSLDEETEDYFNRVDPILKEYEPFYLREYQSTEYVRLTTANVNDIKVIQFTQEVLDLLKREYSLFSWGNYLVRTLPRDLCFFSDHKLVFMCETMEEQSFFYADNDDFLKDLGVAYFESDSPKLDLSISY